MAQDHICRNEPDDENSLLRRNCEDGVGVLDVLGYESEDFVNDHLISMLGAPDLVGDLNELFGVISDTLDDVLGPALNPLQAPIAEIKEFAKDKIQEAIEEELHIDIDQLKSFVTSPTHWLGVQSVSLELPGIGTQQLDLFAARDAHQARRADAPAGRSPHRTSRSRSRASARSPAPASRTTRSSTRSSSPPTATRSRRPSCCCSTATGLNDALGDILAARGDSRAPVVDLRRRRHGAGQRDGRPALGLGAVAALDRLRPRVALRRPPARSSGRQRGARRRQRHVPAVGVLPAAPDVHDALPRLGERQRAVPGARRRCPARTRVIPDAPAGDPAARRHDVHLRRRDLRRRQPPVHRQGRRRRVRRQSGSPPSTGIYKAGQQHPRRVA